IERKNKVVLESREGIEKLIKLRDIPIHNGFGKIEGGNSVSGFTVSITNNDGNKKYIKGKRIIIATGTAPANTVAFNIDHNTILNCEDLMKFDYKKIPKSMLIVGGNFMGCELAYIFNIFGTKVTILEYSPRVIPTQDKLVIDALMEKFKEQGIEVYTNQNILKIEPTKIGARVSSYDITTHRELLESDEINEFEAEICLVTSARRKNTNNIGFEELGGTVRKGKLKINHETMETSIKGIYAIGDVKGGMMLAHVATYEANIAISNILSRIGDYDIVPQKADYSIVPYVIFSSLEIGSIGIRGKAADKLIKKGIATVYTGKYSYSGLSKAEVIGSNEGKMIILADTQTDKIIGASCIGPDASELIAEMAIAMKHGINTKDIGGIGIFELVLEKSKDLSVTQ
ncbi:MAG: NAD(P)/FAD-dependent oxidoreductase, partial [archaeon]|nr:NAD(P)/FAD-dependent oxidoreductase [archaeon]